MSPRATPISLKYHAITFRTTKSEAAADLGNYQQTPASKEQVDPSGYGPIEEAEQRANDLQSKIKAAQREARAKF